VNRVTKASLTTVAWSGKMGSSVDEAALLLKTPKALGVSLQ